ncbi:MAG: hypothetical protein SVM86_03175 [Candidatus Cloacimonadota bacterium]|nr:hypothetical protein [Candidatus Cloacimonadota bacterium]
MKKIIAVLLCQFFSILTAIGLNLPNSAIQNATNNLTLLHREPANFMQNPASYSEGVQTSVSFLYNISEIPYYSLNLNKKNFAFALINLGSSPYQENRAAAGYSYAYGNLRTGVNLKILYVRIDNYNTISTFLVDTAIAWEIENFVTSIALQNVNQARYKGKKLPVTLIWESSWQVTSQGILSVGIEKQRDFEFSSRLGVSYKALNSLKLISSYQYEPNRIGAGVVFTKKKWKISYSVRTHQYLDLTHFISLSYGF